MWTRWRYNTELRQVTVDEVLDLVLQEERVSERVPRAIHMEFELLSWVIPRGRVAVIILQRHRAQLALTFQLIVEFYDWNWQRIKPPGFPPCSGLLIPLVRSVLLLRSIHVGRQRGISYLVRLNPRVTGLIVGDKASSGADTLQFHIRMSFNVGADVTSYPFAS